MTWPPDFSSSRSSNACTQPHRPIRRGASAEVYLSRGFRLLKGYNNMQETIAAGSTVQSCFPSRLPVYIRIDLCWTHLKDVDGWLVDGAHDGAAGVDGVAHSAHNNCGRARIQPRCRLILQHINCASSAPRPDPVNHHAAAKRNTCLANASACVTTSRDMQYHDKRVLPQISGSFFECT